MYILKNAFVSLKRNIGRNLLIGIKVIVIASATTISLAIRSSATSLIESYSNQYEVTASIGVNRESMRGEMKPGEDMNVEDRKENMTDIFSNISSISVDDINSYGESKYVKDYYYQISVGVNSDIEKVIASESTINSRPGMPGNRGTSSDFTINGYSSISAMEDFISGKYSIIDGEVSNEDNNCVINSELATLNDIEVGDDITFTNPDNEEDEITLKVSGIFEEVSDETDDKMSMFTNSANTIITNAAVVSSYSVDNDIRSTTTPTFILTSKDAIDSFSEELTQKGLSQYLSVTTNLDQVESATSTISNLKTFATTFLIITLVIGGIVLFVINMINIRERRYEIGVLRTIGMKKTKLIFQFVTELLIVSLISLVIGASIGSASSLRVSNYLLQNEINSATTSKEDVSNHFGGNMDFKNNNKINGMVEVQAFDKVDAVVNMKVLIELLGIGLTLTLVSSIASMISINKFSPLTILKERS